MSAPYHDATAVDHVTDRADRADSAVCAAVLRTSVAWWGWMSLCGLALAMLCATQGAWIWLGLAWPLWLAATWLTMRLWLDAALFQGLSEPSGAVGSGALLEGALARVLGVQPCPAACSAPRAMASRVAGAMRLFRLLVAVCLVHGMLLPAAVVQQALKG